MLLQEEIADLDQQLKTLKSALQSLSDPSQTASIQSSLAETLKARLDQAADDVERERSLRATQTLIEEVEQRLQRKKDVLLSAAERLNGVCSALEYRRIEINELSRTLFEKLSAFRQFEQQAEHEWKLFYGSDAHRMIQGEIEIVLPEIRAGSERSFAIGKLSID